MRAAEKSVSANGSWIVFLSLSLFVARRAAESAGICNAVATKIREHTNETQQYRSSPDEMQDRKGTTSKQCLHCNISRYLPLLIPTVEPSMSRRKKKKWSKVFLSCNARSRDWTKCYCCCIAHSLTVSNDRTIFLFLFLIFLFLLLEPLFLGAMKTFVLLFIFYWSRFFFCIHSILFYSVAMESIDSARFCFIYSSYVQTFQ